MGEMASRRFKIAYVASNKIESGIVNQVRRLATKSCWITSQYRGMQAETMTLIRTL
jgi:hypothetical protein